MAVEGGKKQGALRAPGHARNVLVVQALARRLTASISPNVQAYFGIHLSGLGVLKNIGLWVGFAAINIHAEGGYGGLVKAQVGEGLAVGAPGNAHVKAKFLFIDPVGCSVNNGIALAVARDRSQLEAAQVLNVDVVLIYKGKIATVGRQHRILNRLAKNMNQFFAFAVKNIDRSLVRMPIDGFNSGL